VAKVHIPAAMRVLTGGVEEVSATGNTLGAVIDSLQGAHPGLKSRLVEEGRLRAGLAVFVDGVQVTGGLSARIGEQSEIYFAPAISGG